MRGLTVAGHLQARFCRIKQKARLFVIPYISSYSISQQPAGGRQVSDWRWTSLTLIAIQEYVRILKWRQGAQYLRYALFYMLSPICLFQARIYIRFICVRESFLRGRDQL